ncbi:hypothetical protein GJ496_011579 [Pomphorhynchus laevis]|nr:hypothetical protein GJ496_011579 [Pomphorhynchus laevis]
MRGRNVSALVDTGSSLNFIDKRVVDKLNTVLIPSETIVHLASSVSKRVLGRCELGFELLGIHYPVSTFYILPNLCEETILGLPFLSRHKSCNIHFGCSMNELKITVASIKTINTPKLFRNLSNDCCPIATKSRQFSETDKILIKKSTEC